MAGCSTSTGEDRSATGTVGDQSTDSDTTGPNSDRTATGPTESHTDRATAESTAGRTTTEPTARTTTTSRATPEPPANRLLRPMTVGEGWAYTDDSMPTVTESGTITGVYRTTQNYTRTIRTRLWPCEGETLDALGGTCSLGSLPERYRNMEDVETTTLPVGENDVRIDDVPKLEIEDLRCWSASRRAT
jgi:hypothetical protein